MANVDEVYDEVEIEEDLGDAKVMPFKYSITSYGADYPVDGLVSA